MKIKVLCLFFLLICLKSVVSAQTMPVGMLGGLEDVYRKDQLLGLDSLKSSFMIRPLYIHDGNPYSLRKLLFSSDKLKAKIYLLPIALQMQQTNLPSSMNDGAMIASRGFQSLVSAGFFASIGPLSVQVRPEYVYAENKDYRTLLETNNAPDFTSSYREFRRSIDLPERFGEGSYKKFNLGQSSVRLNAAGFSIGLSNENLWWGPGMRNSLVMSNNAPGFLHYTFNTVKPLQTYIGSFETQLIHGTLKSSGVEIPASLGLEPKPDIDRNISGIALTYQPKWAPGLYVGFDRTSSDYKTDTTLARPPAGRYNANLDIGTHRDNYTSYYIRWVMPESRAEIYVQYGVKKYTFELPGKNAEDPAIPGSDFLRAYVAGFSKLVALNWGQDQFIRVGLEITEMGNKNPRSLWPAPTWYNNFQITQGYTNKGQLLGAVVGPGGNMQSIDVAWVKGFKRIGLQIDRMVHNNDMFYTMNPYTADMRRHWVDILMGARIDWDYKNFVFNSQFTYQRSLNYQWTFERPTPQYTEFWDWDKQDVGNLDVKLGIMYRF
ncbi:capsule assembly Wzi family protein [Pedobacter metabolipauper]|uniref:Capsule assembly protein Wzi n=1 Tax=Pedobacter metabolipauper TaxID=425513 RepID=A0A4R6SZE1_9SPHI|nr:capsule assembly Wzi family protein [Pedobacter metabolipauper]TDQ09915.1 capsule assembly protein Wzi [Pedobacter metabolipauper]